MVVEMVGAYRVVLVVHIAAAAVSLGSFWLAVAARKGGGSHLAIGRLFVRAMAVMLATGGAMSVALAAAPATFGAPEQPLAGEALAEAVQEARSIGVVLVGITLLTASLLVFGVRARHRLGTRLSERRIDLATLLVPGVLGAVAIPFAPMPGWETLDGVGIMLVATSAFLAYRVVRPALWLREHIVGVLGSGVVIHGALATNLASHLLGFEGAEAFEAAGPVVLVGVALVVWACRHYTPSPRRRHPLADATGAARGMIA